MDAMIYINAIVGPLGVALCLCYALKYNRELYSGLVGWVGALSLLSAILYVMVAFGWNADRVFFRWGLFLQFVIPIIVVTALWGKKHGS